MTEQAPPPPSAGAPVAEPPPLTAFAWRHSLVRPVEGRIFAGVSGALARATNTDPVLWRVILVVLTLFGGIGLVIYLLGWLLLPAEGDTATPVEGLAGRGYSRTTTVRTIIGIVVVAIVFAGYLSDPVGAAPLLAIVLLGGVLLLLLRDQSKGPVAGPPPPMPAPAAMSAPGTPTATATPYGQPPYGPPPAGMPLAPPPFAPHGPFAGPPPLYPPHVAPPRLPRPPRPPKPRSRLGLLTLSVAVLTLGGIIAADLSGADIPELLYLAAPLAIIGLGLLIGTWLGRARWLIPIGVILTLALGAGFAAVHDGDWTRARIGDVSYAPQTVGEIQSRYERELGSLRLDLSDVDFEGRSVEIEVIVAVGNLEIELPPNVDATVNASLDLGSADVLDETWDGIGAENRTVTDLGDDGPGGGRVQITTKVHIGNLEVRR